jgi:hypothetical protein
MPQNRSELAGEAKQQRGRSRVCSCVRPIGADGAATAWLPGRSASLPADGETAASAVSALYEQTAVSLIRLAYVILSDPAGRPDGNTLILTGIRLGSTARIVSGGHYTPIPWSAPIQNAAW